MDGGITVRTAALAAAAGANEAVAGTAVFGAKDLRRAIRWGPSDVLIVSVRICREKNDGFMIFMGIDLGKLKIYGDLAMKQGIQWN